MIPVLISGLLTVLAACAAFRVLSTWPTRTTCPECGQRTVAVASAALPDVVQRRAWRRWCSACEWEGFGRRGPDVSEGPVDHASGFRWRGRPSPRAPLFRWARDEKGDAARPAGRTGADGADAEARGSSSPAHPSGFTWAVSDRAPGAPAHPSGFRWARGEAGADAGQPDPRAAHPSGFAWAEEDRAPPPRRGGRTDGPAAFHWKDSDVA